MPGNLVILRLDDDGGVSNHTFNKQTVHNHGVGLVVALSEVPQTPAMQNRRNDLGTSETYVLVVWSGPHPVTRLDFDNVTTFFDVVR